MAGVDGAYDCVMKTPMGDQKSVLTIISDGDTFQGTTSNVMGSLDVQDGQVDGNRLTWRMEMKVPIPMTLRCEGIVDGDTLSASIDTGSFGKMVMTGTRRS